MNEQLQTSYRQRAEAAEKRAVLAENRLAKMTAAFFGISMRLSGIDQRPITLEEIAKIADQALRG